MQVGCCAATRRADVTDNVILPDFLSNFHIESGKVAHARRQTIAVVDDDEIPVSGVPLSENDLSVGRSVNLRTEKSANIDAEMHLRRFSVERIGPASKMTGDVTLDRPYRGGDSADRSLLLRKFL